ncbi:MAG: TIR domain-containing protein [Clostridia bacterium]|nr:TIR domain-containing protein [Clostridia bacterium]
MKDIFISYKTEDIAQARKVRDHLEHEGLSVWMAPDSITGGASYAAEIPPAIDNAKVFVLILSQKAQESRWVPRELDQAINDDKKIMPFMIEDCPLNSEFKFYLTNIQRYPAFENYDKALKKMTDEIKQYLAPPKQEVKITEPKPKKVEKSKAPKKNKGKKIGLAILGVLLAVIMCTFAMNKMNTLTIAGEDVKKDETSLYVYKKELNGDDINAIAQMNDLRVLSFEECTINANDLGGIVKESLHNISFENCNLTKDQLASLDLSKCKLGSLELTGCDLDSLDIIAGQEENLTTLRISDTKVNDLSILSGFTNLNELEANNCNISDLSPLANCTEISVLKLNGNEIASLKPLENLTGLTKLRVANNKLTSLEGIEKAIELSEIEADGNEIESLDGLANTTLLRVVSLNNNKISDISILAKSAETLVYAYLGDNAIGDITPLEKCGKIKYLNLGGNEIADLSGIEKLIAVESLDLSHNALEGKIAIRNLPELRYLSLADNSVTELDVSLRDEMHNVILLDGNPLTKLTTGYTQGYRMLTLGENQLDDYADIYNSKGRIMLNYSEKLDFDKLKAAGYNKITLIGAPLDKQVAIKEKLGAGIVEFAEKAEYDVNTIMPDFTRGIDW